MSAVAPLRRPAAKAIVSPRPARGTGTSSRPRLVLVSQRGTTAGRLPFLVLIGALLVVGLVSVLLLHMFAAQDAFKATAMQANLNRLTARQQQLERIVELDSAPAGLRERAAALGMVSTRVVSYHRLKDGRAIGVEVPIIASVAPPATTSTTKKTTTAKTVPGASTKTAPNTTTAPPKGKAAHSASSNTATSPKTGAHGTTTGTHHGHAPAR